MSFSSLHFGGCECREGGVVLYIFSLLLEGEESVDRELLFCIADAAAS